MNWWVGRKGSFSDWFDISETEINVIPNSNTIIQRLWLQISVVNENHFLASKWKKTVVFQGERDLVSGALINSCFTIEKPQKTVLEIHVGINLHLNQ